MVVFSPPWPPALLEPMEYGSFLWVPGLPKAKSRGIPPILSEIRRNQHLQPFYMQMLIFGDLPLCAVQGPSKRLHIRLVLEGLEAMGAQGRPIHQNGAHFTKFHEIPPF